MPIQSRNLYECRLSLLNCNYSLKFISTLFCRTVDPHGVSRGRKLSVGLRGSTNGDHLDALAEGPEGDNSSDSETDTLSTSPRVSMGKNFVMTQRSQEFFL